MSLEVVKNPWIWKNYMDIQFRRWFYYISFADVIVITKQQAAFMRIGASPCEPTVREDDVSYPNTDLKINCRCYSNNGVFIRTTRNEGVKFQNDDQKNITILMVPKSQYFWKKSNRIGLDSFKNLLSTLTGWFYMIVELMNFESLSN